MFLVIQGELSSSVTATTLTRGMSKTLGRRGSRNGDDSLPPGRTGSCQLRVACSSTATSSVNQHRQRREAKPHRQ
jgi:hypothetical protein